MRVGCSSGREGHIPSPGPQALRCIRQNSGNGFPNEREQARVPALPWPASSHASGTGSARGPTFNRKRPGPVPAGPTFLLASIDGIPWDKSGVGHPMNRAVPGFVLSRIPWEIAARVPKVLVRFHSLHRVIPSHVGISVYHRLQCPGWFCPQRARCDHRSRPRMGAAVRGSPALHSSEPEPTH